jgi:hypothetical protein
VRNAPARETATTHPSVVMPTVRGIHDPAELALYGIPEGVWAWLIEPDAADLTARGVNSALYRVTVVGIDRWSPDPTGAVDVDYPDARMVGLPGLTRFDVRYLSVCLLDTPAQLVWSAAPGMEPRLDMLHIEGLKSAQVVGLFRARRLVDLDWGPSLGRRLGDTDLSSSEFELQMAVALAVLRRLKVPLTQDALADEIGLDTSTLRKYLKGGGVDWRSVVKRERPASK